MSQQSAIGRLGGLAMKIILPIIAIALGGAAFAYFKATAPVMKRGAPSKQSTLVEVIKAEVSDYKHLVDAMGTVVPAREVTMRARVSGQVVEVSGNLVPGGHLAKGDTLVRLDPADYEVKVLQAQADLTQAEADLAIELGSQQVAKEELDLMKQMAGDKVEQTDLALRKPQLKKAQAQVATAQAALRQAKLNLDRTRITAPFNALVLERGVDLGSHVSTQDSLATLTATDEYWVEAMLPMDRLEALIIDPEHGSPVKVESTDGRTSWKGRAVRLSGSLNEESRMAKLIISVPDPMGLKHGGPRLMLDDYVNVLIEGSDLPGVVMLPRSAVRDGGTVWLLSEGKLEIRQVDAAWKQGEYVFIAKGIAPGEQIITSAITAAVDGMNLRTVAEAGEKGGRDAGKAGEAEK